MFHDRSVLESVTGDAAADDVVFGFVVKLFRKIRWVSVWMCFASMCGCACCMCLSMQTCICTVFLRANAFQLLHVRVLCVYVWMYVCVSERESG